MSKGWRAKWGGRGAVHRPQDPHSPLTRVAQRGGPPAGLRGHWNPPSSDLAPHLGDPLPPPLCGEGQGQLGCLHPLRWGHTGKAGDGPGHMCLQRTEGRWGRKCSLLHRSSRPPPTLGRLLPAQSLFSLGLRASLLCAWGLAAVQPGAGPNETLTHVSLEGF